VVKATFLVIRRSRGHDSLYVMDDTSDEPAATSAGDHDLDQACRPPTTGECCARWIRHARRIFVLLGGSGRARRRCSNGAGTRQTDAGSILRTGRYHLVLDGRTDGPPQHRRSVSGLALFNFDSRENVALPLQESPRLPIR
jgi:hypothetical protein